MRKRGVSTLLASVILIVIVLAASVIIYMNFSKQITASGKSLDLTATTIEFKTTSSLKIKFYIIYINGISGAWVNPQYFYQGVVETLSKRSDANAKIVRISTLAELDDLVRNSPSDAVVINCHGERVPMPTTWPNWQSYFKALGNNVKNYGWIFVTSRGYPFYYTQLGVVGSAGLNTFLSVVGASANAWGNTWHSPTSAGTEALNLFGYTPANPLRGWRTVSWSGITPTYRFYAQSSGRDLAAAVKMGSGFYLNFDGTGLSDRDAGRYTGAFAYWLATKKFSAPPLNLLRLELHNTGNIPITRVTIKLSNNVIYDNSSANLEPGSSLKLNLKIDGIFSIGETYTIFIQYYSATGDAGTKQYEVRVGPM